MTFSMTGFSTKSGAFNSHTWAWEIKSVNGKGLDIRARIPDWVEGLEHETRQRLTQAFNRGSFTAQCKISSEEGDSHFHVDDAALEKAILALKHIETEAQASALTLKQISAKDLLDIKGVLVTGNDSPDIGALKSELLKSLSDCLADLKDMRAIEGAQLQTVISDQLTTIEELVGAAQAVIPERRDEMDARFSTAMERVLEAADPDRIATELALMAVKADVTEELDRLRVHIDAARALLAQDGPKGRKLDFLAQEFNREANTLCSKSQHAELTAIGLELKTVIDQMREQIQNVE